MKINFKNYNKKDKGITLITLVITIILMLIIAGVAINLTFKEDIVGKTVQITNSTEKVTENTAGKLNELEGILLKNIL